MSAGNGKNAPRHLLIINSGSSSIRFSSRDAAAPERESVSGKIDRIGAGHSLFAWRDTTDDTSGKEERDFADHAQAVDFLLGWLESRAASGDLAAIGHRVVHGGPKYFEPTHVSPELLEELKRITPYDPQHLRSQIALIEIFQKHKPGLPQFVCFDTAFHREMPLEAKMFALPRKYFDEGIYRYGFHGLSYAYMLDELKRLDGATAAQGRLILAHLGNGASLCAVREGKSIDTTMAFTPAAGIPMSARSGDLDPGLFLFLSRTKGMTPDEFQRMVNYESGLLGVSGTGSDMRDLQARESSDAHAAEAVNLFCYHVRKAIGSYAAALGGLDLLAFAGGIGENGPEIRARVCHSLAFLGLEIDAARNAASIPVISTDASRVRVRVIRTNEELMIARAIAQMLSLP